MFRAFLVGRVPHAASTRVFQQPAGSKARCLVQSVTVSATITLGEPLGSRVARIDIDANATRILFLKPRCHLAKKFRRDTPSSPLRNDIDPLQFAGTAMTASEMACHEADQRVAVHCDKNDARH